MFWDTRVSYASVALAGMETVSATELRQRIAALDQLLAAKNQEIASVRAAKGSTKGVMSEYIELTKARDLLRGKLKVAEASRQMPTARPMPTAPAVAFPIPLEAEPALVPGTCYEGRVPNDRFLRGVQVGSDEPFAKGGHTIGRSDACSTGWMVLDPSRAARAASSTSPVVRRRAQLPPMPFNLEERISRWHGLYVESYAPHYIESEGMTKQQAYDAAAYAVNAERLQQFILENSDDWRDWGVTKPQLLQYIDQYFISRGQPEKARR